MSSPPLWPDRLPGASLAAELAEVDLVGLSDGELIDVMAAWRRQASWAQAGELAAVSELARRREADSSCDGEFTAAEVGLALTVSPRTADAHVEFARTLAFRLPLTRRALERGRIDVVKARVIAQGTRTVDDAVARAVERRVLPGATDQTPGRLRARVERAVLALDPAGAEERRKASEADRRVDCYDTGNGTAVLGGVHLPAGPAIAADNRLHAIAKAIKADGDPRTLDQLSADVFLSLLLGTHPASGQPTTKHTAALARSAAGDPSAATGSHAQADPAEAAAPGSASIPALVAAAGERIGTVHLTVPLTTLFGLEAEPGEVAGYGPLTAEIARQLAFSATNPRTRWCVTVTGAEGEPVHHGHPAYRPPAAMAHLVRTLRPACGFPGCVRPSQACDLDHRISHDQGGTTCPCNLQPPCRRHHRTKQAKGWKIAQHADWLAWTTPAGKTYLKERAYLDEQTHLDKRTNLDEQGHLDERTRLNEVRRPQSEIRRQRSRGSPADTYVRRCLLDLPHHHRSPIPLRR